MSPTTVSRRDPSTNMMGAAVAFLVILIVLGMIAGADMYAIAAGVVMLALVAAVYFGRIVAT